MGFIEVVKNLRTIFKNIEFCKQDILNHKPDVIILIDYPCLLYTSDAADERSSVDLGGRRIIKKKKSIDNSRVQR